VKWRKSDYMRILWLCNIMLPELASEFSLGKINVGGWLTGLWKRLKETNIDLAICVPVGNAELLKDGTYDGYKYYSFIVDYDGTDGIGQLEIFKNVLDDFNPDVVHIWGTEYIHTYNMIMACKEKKLQNRVIVNIQGLLTYYSKVFDIGIPEDVFHEKMNNVAICDERDNFDLRGEFEKKDFALVNCFVGRTDWDRACTYELNPRARYVHCGEIIRENFYSERKWKYDDCTKHSIFVSQASYPIKGFHVVLDEIVRLKEIYPDLVVKVAGPELSLEFSPYAKYVYKLIKEKKLEKTIIFLGNLDAEQMKKEFLNANVFLSPSLIENSSNSICEAMNLGVPTVSSFVGGTSSLIDSEINGYLYPLNEPYLMSFYVRKIFDSREEISEISRNAIKKGKQLNNPEQILKTMLGLYEEIANG